MIVAVVGPPRSAKSRIGAAIAELIGLKGDEHIKTDNWKQWTYLRAKDEIVKSIELAMRAKPDRDLVISGMQAPRVMRQLARNGSVFADIVVRVECNEATLHHFYTKEGDEHKIPNLSRTIKATNTVIESWLEVARDKGHEPEVITVNSSIKWEEL